MIQDPAARAFRPLYFDSHPDPLGAVSLPVATHLLRRGLLEDDKRLLLAGCDPTSRLEDIRAELFRCGWIEPPRHEQMPVTDGPHGVELARLDRSALRILGFWAQKVHINGLVEPDRPGGPQVWISRRSDLAPSNPGRWDTLVAGGRAAGHSLLQTAAREGWEEAGIECVQMTGLTHVGDMAVQYVSRRGFHQELLVIHDLALPRDFVAVCRDGEIEESIRLSFDDLVIRLADAREFKFSSYLVLTDLVGRKRGGSVKLHQCL